MGNDLLVSNDVTGRCYEVEDEFLNSSTSTVGGDAKNDIEDTPTQTFTEGDVAEDKVPSDVDTSIKDSNSNLNSCDNIFDFFACCNLNAKL